MDIDQQVAEWKAAKEAKDYSTADRIRSELRAAGHEPDQPRGGRGGDKDLVRQWEEAKRNKDYSTADRLRAELRAKGIDPDPHGSAPPVPHVGAVGGSWGPAGAGGWGFMAPMQAPMAYMAPAPMRAKPYKASMEAELDRWADAKADKDYETADAIREGLRARGISPSKERPLHVGAQELVQQWQAAKQAKDYGRSDRIREELRAQGIDPQKAVPSMGWGMEQAFAPMPMRAPMMMHAPPVAVPKRSKMHSLSTMDARVIDELSQWFDAKEQKNWPAADSIRERLRKKGIEPSECQRPGSAGLDDDMEAELGRWYEARDAKDWATADSIREGLRAGGVEPSQCPRPSASNGGYGKAPSHAGARASPYSAGPGLGGFDRAMEQRLDQWWKAKQDKNFGVADAIRKEMRDQNIEPENHRPRR